MKLSYPDAVSWAQARSASETPRLGMLEAVACQRYPEVVRTFGSDGEALAGILQTRPPGAKKRAGTLAAAVVTGVAFLGPIAGMAAIAARRFRSFETAFPAAQSIPIADACFTAGAIAIVILLIASVRDRRALGVLGAVIGGAAVAMAVLTSISMPTVAEQQAYPLTLANLVPVWVAGVLALPLAVLGYVGDRAQRSEKVEPVPVRPPTATERVSAENAVLAIPDRERAAIRADRDAALHVLADRGFIGVDVLERAVRAPLGGLYTLDS